MRMMVILFILLLAFGGIGLFLRKDLKQNANQRETYFSILILMALFTVLYTVLYYVIY